MTTLLLQVSTTLLGHSDPQRKSLQCQRLTLQSQHRIAKKINLRLKTSTNGTQAPSITTFALRPTAETLADLSRPGAGTKRLRRLAADAMPRPATHNRLRSEQEPSLRPLSRFRSGEAGKRLRQQNGGNLRDRAPRLRTETLQMIEGLT